MSVSSVPMLEANLGILSQDEKQVAQLLVEAGQSHLFNVWPAPGEKDELKKKLLAQAKLLDAQYPGGLVSYVKNARKLLEESKLGVNPFSGLAPSVPEGERLEAGSDAWHQSENMGLLALRSTGFVLVAGGLGERLGYQGIKISLPTETVTEKSFIQLYVEQILAFQERARRSSGNPHLMLPLAIMTSGDTHDATVNLLAANKNFGLSDDQIHIIKQEKVPSLMDNDARFAVDDENPFEISTKPHGHGDVHTLLHMSGIVKKWVNTGIEWIVFFQDTNGIVFRALPAALGVSKANDFDVNSLTVPRKPGEAVGGICKLNKDDGTSLTINVEYNQLDPLLRSTISPDGDIPDHTGFSPFPGNINVLVFKAINYRDVLEKTGGAVPEFVNPKYKDSAKNVFKKPTRLECMMQDYPKLLDHSARVGFTQIDRWLSFSAVKNSLAEAQAKYHATGFAESASSGESDIYYLNRRLLSLGAKVEIEETESTECYGGIPVHLGAKIVLSPSFGITQDEIAKKLSSANVKISSRSTLVLDGEDIELRNLTLDGALIITVKNGSKVVVDNLTVKNSGYHFKGIDPTDSSIDQKYQIRGYVMDKLEKAEYIFDDGKLHVLSS